MSKISMHSRELGRVASSTSIFNIYTIVPIAVCAYALIISPLLMYADAPPPDAPAAVKEVAKMAPRAENKFVWPALAAMAAILMANNWSRIIWPRHVLWLAAYLSLAAASIVWAFKPEFALSRFALQLMICTAIIPPAMMAGPKTDMMRGLFLCYACATILNVYFVNNQEPIIYNGDEIIGYPGYYAFKGILGECAAVAFLFALNELFYSALRKVLGLIIIGVSIWLVIQSYSKGSLAMAIVAPVIAAFTLSIGKAMRLSPAMVLLPIPIFYILLSFVVGNLTNRISWIIFQNYTLTGRTVIWDFVNYEISRRPLLGWGYQSFWLVGGDSPSVAEAPGWVAQMPSSHNGYMDTTVDTGYVGLAIFLAFLFTTLHVIQRVADQDRIRAWHLLTLALYVMLTNLLESTWLHGSDMLWLVFAFVVGEIGRYCQQPVHPGGAQHRYRRPAMRAPQAPGRLISSTSSSWRSGQRHRDSAQG